MIDQFSALLQHHEVVTVTTKLTRWQSFTDCPTFSRVPVRCLDRKGQAMIEFTFTFLLLLIIAWIPADFGLAFFTGHQLQNSAREGARIAAADTTLVAQMGGNTTLTCTAPCATQPDVMQKAAARLSNVLVKTATVTLTYPASGAGTCNQMLTVQVQGTYNFFFYQLLRLIGVTNTVNTATISRITSMRYEHQTPCNPF